MSMLDKAMKTAGVDVNGTLDEFLDLMRGMNTKLEELLEIERNREGKHPNGSRTVPRNGTSNPGRGGRTADRASA